MTYLLNSTPAPAASNPRGATTLNHLAAEPIVRAELEAFYIRCEQAGVPREIAKGHVQKRPAHSVLTEALASLDHMYTPKNVEMLRVDESIVPRDVFGSREVPQDIALAWLAKTHGAKIGDIVSVGGWAVPREILIEEFRMDENREGEWFMWFNGPTAYPKCTERRNNGTPGYSSVYRVNSSPRIERFLSWEKADLAARPAPVIKAPAPKAPVAPPEPVKVYPEAKRQDILARILAAEKAGDLALQDKISLEWLEAVHGVRPGDYVRVTMYGGNSRVLYLTGLLQPNLDRPVNVQYMSLQGPCEHEGKARHLRNIIHLTEDVHKVEEGDVPKCLKDFVRRSRAAAVVAARDQVAA